MDHRLTCTALVTCLMAYCAGSGAELKPEKARAETLPDKPGAHWLWVNDLVFNHMEAGKAFLLDADSGQMLGMLSTGYFFGSLVVPSDYGVIYSPETYLSRGNRGKRTDVITYYDPKTLGVITEVEIPPKRLTAVSMLGMANLTSDNRFLAVFNFTPAQSVTIVDTQAKAVVQEAETPGCAQVYTAGQRAFNMVCGDGSMMTLQLDDSGQVSSTERTEGFYAPKKDMIDDKVARDGNTWYFFTTHGIVKTVDMSNGKPKMLEEWSLFTDADKSWRAGGYQYASVHPARNELYLLVHEGGPWTHKYPGEDVWVYDLTSKKRTRKIKLSYMATAIEVSEDAAPLLYTVDVKHAGVHVYDAQSGKHVREIAEIGFSPMLLQAVSQ